MSRPKPWPKAANEARSDVIMEAGSIRVRTRSTREKLSELQKVIERRDLLLALAIIAHIDSLAQVIDKSAEIITIKLENARAEEDNTIV
jgi:hypothetical protein